MNQVPKFDKVHCSQCGGEFGPRDSGYSHCSDHLPNTIAVERIQEIRDRTSECMRGGEEEMVVTSSELRDICDHALTGMKADPTDYENITEAIRQAPQTFMPALLATAVEACIDKKVFRNGKSIERFVVAAILRKVNPLGER